LDFKFGDCVLFNGSIFIEKKIKVIIAFLLLSLLLKVILFYYGFTKDPWSYRFLFSELFLFFTGALSYRLYKKTNTGIFSNNHITYILFLSFILTGFFSSFLYKNLGILIVPLVYLIFICMLPFLFEKTKNNKVDRSIGELSYPVYIVHLLVIAFIQRISSEEYVSLLSIIGSILFAVILNKFVQEKIEKIRANNLKK
jgi:peptidoglycan/LPS O-acetylase OafA/YrhL